MVIDSWFFDGWAGVVRTLVAGILTYPMLVLVLRLSGKRTLAKMNAFDLVVTVALGSTLATVLLNADVSLAEGAAAFVLLAGAQFVVATLAVHSKQFRKLAKSSPSLLLSDGTMLMPVMQRERVTPGEVRQAIRAQGVGDLKDVAAVVLETDGSFSVVPRSSVGSGDALAEL